MMQRFGEVPIPGQRYEIRTGAYAILPRDGAVLITYQEAPTPELQLPGGGVDPGESPVQALHREVYEETGWKIAPPRRVGAYRRFTYMPEYDKWAEKICLIYVARPTVRMGPPLEPGHQAVWTSPEDALRLLSNSGDRSFAARVL
jgi:8-oxo-dGTP diphosphatase